MVIMNVLLHKTLIQLPFKGRHVLMAKLKLLSTIKLTLATV